MYSCNPSGPLGEMLDYTIDSPGLLGYRNLQRKISKSRLTPRSPDYFVIVNDLLAVSTVAPPGSLRVIVSVAAPSSSVRICHTTDDEPPAGTLGSDWLVLRGFSARIEPDGLKLTSTV